MRASTRLHGEEYYKCVLMCVDDILEISFDSNSILKNIKHMVKFNNVNIEVPDIYLV